MCLISVKKTLYNTARMLIYKLAVTVGIHHKSGKVCQVITEVDYNKKNRSLPGSILQHFSATLYTNMFKLFMMLYCMCCENIFEFEKKTNAFELN